MKLVEVFLIETTEEDRAIVSLASAIVDYIQSRQLDNSSMPIELGKIGDLFDTPHELLRNVSIVIDDKQGLHHALGRTGSAEKSSVSAVWNPNTESITLLDELLGEGKLRLIRLFSHELRHALDDYKSDFRACQSDRYNTPKNKKFCGVTKDPEYGNLEYKARPSEINARFLEVLSLLTRTIPRNYNLYSPDQAFKKSQEEFFNFLERKQISQMFPEKESSKDYKRLVKRGMDFIEKEIKFLQGN